MNASSAFRSVRIRAALSLGLVLGLGSVATLAAWSTTASTTSGTFVTGTVDIKFDDGTPLGNQGIATVPYVVPFPAGTLLPGQSTAQVIRVQNSGTLRFTHTRAVSAVGQGLALASRLTTGNPIQSGNSRVCSGTDLAPTMARPVEPAAVDALCVQVTMPATLVTTDQGKSGSVDILFTVDAASV